MDEGNYKLIAESQSGLTFTNEMSISLPSKSQSIFIQTDKAMYKPGDKVKFRVLVLDSNTNPITVTNMKVFITVSYYELVDITRIVNFFSAEFRMRRTIESNNG